MMTGLPNLAEDLRRQYHFVDIAGDGIKAGMRQVSFVWSRFVDVPQLDGITLCRRLRSAKCTTPILMLTARDTTTDKVVGLDSGADDYLVKPFE